MTLPTLKAPISKNILDYLLNWINNVFQSATYDPNNTVSGTNSVELNTLSGAAVFSDPIADASIKYYTILNSNFRAGQKIDPEIEYDNQEGGNGAPYIVNHTITDGQCLIGIGNNLDRNPTGSPITVMFKIQ